MKCFSHARRPAFTLIEMLVVMSVIALMVALILPALGQARMVAKAAICKSNQRQIGLAAATYRSDFRDFVPIHLGYGAAPAVPGWRRSLASHMRSAPLSLFDCPLTVNPNRADADLDSMNVGSYGVIGEHHAYLLQSAGYHFEGSVLVIHNKYGIHKNNSGDFRDQAWPLDGGWRDPERSMYIADSYITWDGITTRYPSVEATFGSDHIHRPDSGGYIANDGWGVRRFADRHQGTHVLMHNGSVRLIPTQILDAMNVNQATDNIWDAW